MSKSTLSPGVVSQTIAKLRDDAIREMDAPESGSVKAGEISFDRAIDVQPKFTNLDHPLDTPPYPGPNSPHIGNGSGGPR